MKLFELRQFREQKKLKQYQMAEILNISRVHYNKIENGKNNPSVELLKTFSKEFPEVDDVLKMFKNN